MVGDASCGEISPSSGRRWNRDLSAKKLDVLFGHKSRLLYINVSLPPSPSVCVAECEANSGRAYCSKDPAF